MLTVYHHIRHTRLFPSCTQGMALHSTAITFRYGACSIQDAHNEKNCDIALAGYLTSALFNDYTHARSS